VIRGLRALAEEVARLRPDAIVIASAHWVTTFQHYVSGATRLAGILSATEVPGESRNLPYDYPGDPELAWALVAAGVAAGVPAVVTTECTLPLDSGTVIPLRYVTPASDVPIVSISLCQLADLGEMLRWGRAIGAAVRAGRLVVQRCVGCGTLAVPPKAVCPVCEATQWEGAALGGDGEVVSFTVIRVPPGRLAAEAPYVIVVARMVEGVSLLGRLVGAPIETAHVGLPVRFVPPTDPAAEPPGSTFTPRL